MSKQKYDPFSRSKNIEKMVRTIDVLSEQQTLEVFLLPWNGAPWKTCPDWIKYVSTGENNKLKVYLYWDQIIEDRFVMDLGKKLKRDKDLFSQLEKLFLKVNREFKKFAKGLCKKGPDHYSHLDDKKILEMFEKYEQKSRMLWVGYYIPYYLCMVTLSELEKKLKKKNKEDWEETLRIISTLGIRSIVAFERKKFLRNLLVIQKKLKKGIKWQDSKIQAIITKHYHEIGPCIYTHGENRAYSLKDYQKKFKKNLRHDASLELRKIEERESGENKRIKKLLSEIKSDQETYRYSLWLRKMMGYRNCEAEFYHIYLDWISPFFENLAKRLSIREDDFWYLSKEEIINGILGKIKVHHIIKDRRKYGLTIKQVGKKIEVLAGVRSEDIHEEIIKRKEKILKGTVAFRGKEKGQVHIILDPFHEGKYFRENEILVTSMTTPEYVPLMKRAKAIVTDEGGLLCHAAIVARELKKPCVIGTKIATKVLRDGDLVMVDANKGIINR